MSVPTFNPRSAVLLLIIVIVAALRYAAFTDMGPLTVFTPIGAMALFGGAYFKRNVQAYLFPLLTLWFGDIILNRFVYFNEWRLLYDGWYFTYGAYALMVFAGKRMIKKANVKNIVLASLVATLIHWIGTSPSCLMIANSMYPKTWDGYLASLVAAIPYERNFLLGTLAYSGILFGLFEWAAVKYKLNIEQGMGKKY
jgi:hypothetical protein